MKRLRIWLANFTLVQQFLSLVLIVCGISVIFIVYFFNNNVDIFVNDQMHVYIHRAQNEYIETRKQDNESNVVHFVYSTSNKYYLNDVSDEYMSILNRINPMVELGIASDGMIAVDGYIYNNDANIVYSVTDLDNEYRLVSIIKNSFREEFKSALFTSVIDTVFYVVIALIALILIWIMSLMRPIKTIINFINRIKEGEKPQLNLIRHDEIGELAESISSMHEEILKQQSIRDEMVQNISHDLKTPIATIKSYSESIKDGIYPYGSLEKSVDVIIENANRLEKKVYSLLTYNKVGYLVDENPNILNLRMAPIIQKAVMDNVAIRSDININLDIDEEVYFHGEEEPWRVVVENLLDNALRYARTSINITLEENLLEVFNDGEQISEEHLTTMFKPYEKGTKGKFGLGLSIVKKVSETYGYNVTGENMNDGVVFRIYTNKRMKKLPKRKPNKKGIIE